MSQFSLTLIQVRALYSLSCVIHGPIQAQRKGALFVYKWVCMCVRACASMCSVRVGTCESVYRKGTKSIKQS